MTIEAAAEPRIHELLCPQLHGGRDLDGSGRDDPRTRSPERGAQKLLDRMPSFVFSAAGPVHVSRDLGLLSFNLGVPEQPPAVSGIDVALVRGGRIAVLHTLLTA